MIRLSFSSQYLNIQFSFQEHFVAKNVDEFSESLCQVASKAFKSVVGFTTRPKRSKNFNSESNSTKLQLPTLLTTIEANVIELIIQAYKDFLFILNFNSIHRIPILYDASSQTTDKSPEFSMIDTLESRLEVRAPCC